MKKEGEGGYTGPPKEYFQNLLSEYPMTHFYNQKTPPDKIYQKSNVLPTPLVLKYNEPMIIHIIDICSQIFWVPSNEGLFSTSVGTKSLSYYHVN